MQKRVRIEDSVSPDSGCLLRHLKKEDVQRQLHTNPEIVPAVDARPSSCAREVNHNKIASGSPEQYPSVASERREELCCSKDESLEIIPIMDLTDEDDKQMIMEVNGIHKNGILF
ncbi:hypothetical protein OROMI_000741 [Orobanche minor]